MPKLSAGVLLHRVRGDVVEVLIGHPGGPFWARKDDGAWSIPKGEYAPGDDPWEAARREFAEELGVPLRQAILPRHGRAAELARAVVPAAVHGPVPAERRAVLDQKHRLHPDRRPVLEPRRRRRSVAMRG